MICAAVLFSSRQRTLRARTERDGEHFRILIAVTIVFIVFQFFAAVIDGSD